MELTSPHKDIKNSSTYGVILTENKLKTGRNSYTTKALRKIHTESGKEGKRKAQVGICILERGHRRTGGLRGSEILHGQ